MDYTRLRYQASQKRFRAIDSWSEAAPSSLLLNMKQSLFAGCFFLILEGLNGQELSRYEYQHPQMGTLFRIVLYAEDSALARHAASKAFARIDELNYRLSDYLSESELNQLSSTAGSGKWVTVSGDLWQVLDFSIVVGKASRGAFDISIGPLSILWREAFWKKEFPQEAVLEKARGLVDYQNISLDRGSRRVMLSQRGMRLDLGGIAKGYALDEAMLVLQESGIDIALVDGGGDVLAGEAPPEEDSGWKVLYQKYGSDGQLSWNSLWLENQAIATSGDHYQFLEWNNRRYSHIIDPRTGLGLTSRRLVTVVGPSGIIADALASACSIMGDEQREKVLQQFPEVSVEIASAHNREFK